MSRKRAKTPKMSAADIQNVLHELDAWCRRERPGRLSWRHLETFSGFTRQALSGRDEIAERFGAAKTVNRPSSAAQRRAPKNSDQRIIDLQRDIEHLRAVINRYDERWARYARNASLQGVDLARLDEPLDPPARASVHVVRRRGKQGRRGSARW